MHTDDESEIEYTVVKRVASVTIESDSQAEVEAEQRSGRNRRKKRVVKRKGCSEKMDVDVSFPQPSTGSKGYFPDGQLLVKGLSVGLFW